MTTYHLAQLNIGQIRGTLDSEIMADFTNNIDRINALAEESPGFVWRLEGEDGGSSSTVKAYDDPLMIVNLSVWENIETLKDYAYRTEHVEFFKRRKEWFHTMDTPHMVLWWIPEGHIPTVEEAKAKLDYLIEHGSTPQAFTFAKPFPAETLSQTTNEPIAK